MGRIPDDELTRLKREVSLLELVRAAGVELRRHGADWLGRCPFHNDRTPSLVVTPAKNLWHCLGACQAGGSVIDWVMRREGVSFRHAVERLRGDLADEAAAPALALDPEADDATLLAAVVDFYHRTLVTRPEGLAYLASRGLDHRGAIDHFKLGLANRTLAYQLPAKSRKRGALIRGRLQELGILRASGHEHLNGSVVVPVVSPEGAVTELYGRKLRDDLRPGTPVHLYLPGPHRGVWNVAVFQESREIILCEALLDALTFWVAGFRNVTASYGTAGLTAEHLAAFKEHNVERVLIAYDRDAAGDRAAQQVARQLTELGVACYRIQFPREMDANSYALASQPASESLGRLIRHAAWLGTGPPPARHTPAAAPSSIAASSLAADPIPPPATPEPGPLPPGIALQETAHELVLTLGDRRYRVRGLERNLGPEALKVTLIAERAGAVHADTLDLYAARPRAQVTAQAARQLAVDEAVIHHDLGTLLLELETRRDQRLAGATLRPDDRADTAPGPPPLTPAEHTAALELLKDPKLLDRITRDFARAGLVGEETTALVGYLAAVSRKLPAPLAVIVQSASAAGKTSLMDAILAFVPPHERVHYSALTGQALYYLGEEDLKHKVLSVVEEAGAERASYALKLLQSEGELVIASTGKDPHSGKLVTHEYRVEGPVQLFLTTTAVVLDEELANRALVLTVDESAGQTRAIHQRQRHSRTLDGLLARAERARVIEVQQHAQRLIEALAVVNPFAPALTFQDTRTRTRRDHEKYLTLIDAIALVHQHQRQVKSVTRGGRTLRYVEVTPDDIAVAGRLAAEVLRRSADELPPQTRRFVEALAAWVTDESARRGVPPERLLMTAREIREAIGLGATQVKVHLRRLVDLEYVRLHRAPRGQGVVYELSSVGADLEADFPGLLDPARLSERGYDPERPASKDQRSGGGRPPFGPRPGGGRTSQRGSILSPDTTLDELRSDQAETHINGRAPAWSHVS